MARTQNALGIQPSRASNSPELSLACRRLNAESCSASLLGFGMAFGATIGRQNKRIVASFMVVMRDCKKCGYLSKIVDLGDCFGLSSWSERDERWGVSNATRLQSFAGDDGVGQRFDFGPLPIVYRNKTA